MAELHQTSNVELLVSSVNVLGSCCSCREKEGVLRCSGCKAVTYCGKECQEKGWNEHKKICNEINQLLQQVKAAIEALVYEYGGVDALLKDPFVKDGRFRFRDQYLSSNDPRNFMFDKNIGPTKTEKYDIARWKLIKAYAKCGKEASNKLAFRLAAENLLHMLQLCRNGKNQVHDSPHMPASTWHKYCGWMVAGDMDRQALNFLGFIQAKQWNLVTPRLDLSFEEDIEGLSVVSRVKEKVLSTFAPRFKVHDLMLISLIKLKRIKDLSVLRKREEERWNAFLEGTQSRSGEFSVVLMISGMAPVLEGLKGFVVDKAIDQRIDSLTNQINGLLIEVNEENPKLIRDILDGQVQKVDNPNYPETDEDKDEKEEQSHARLYVCYHIQLGVHDNVIPPEEKEVHIARYAVSKYGHAWHIDNDFTRALRLFLETGRVMEEEEDTTPETVAVEENTSPQTVTMERDISPEIESTKEDASPQTEMAEEDTYPETEMVEEDASRETEMWEKDTSPETEMTKDDKSPETMNQYDKKTNLGAIGKIEENIVNKSHFKAIKTDEAVSDDRESDEDIAVEEKKDWDCLTMRSKNLMEM